MKGILFEWDCIDHKWVLWFWPKAMPQHNAWGSDNLSILEKGKIVNIFCGIAFPLTKKQQQKNNKMMGIK